MTLYDTVLQKLGLTATPELKDKLLTYAELIKQENEKYNLTAVIDDDGIAVKHFEDSFAVLGKLGGVERVCDLGSGAGLPVIPLALVNKDIEFTAVESTGKKCNFLNLVIEKLVIGNLNVQNCRIESFAHGKGREVFDVVTARAVAPLNVLLEYMAPLAKVGGKLLCYKGSKYPEEQESAKRAVEVFKLKENEIYKYDLENGEKRVIIEYTKMKATPEEFPRDGNKPRLKPIC